MEYLRRSNRNLHSGFKAVRSLSVSEGSAGFTGLQFLVQGGPKVCKMGGRPPMPSHHQYHLLLSFFSSSSLPFRLSTASVRNLKHDIARRCTALRGKRDSCSTNWIATVPVANYTLGSPNLNQVHGSIDMHCYILLLLLLITVRIL